jgi:hypothetical protein
MKDLNSTEWKNLDVTKGTFYNRNTSNSIYLVDSATEPANANDAVVLHPGEKKYLESTSGKIYAKTVRGEAELATSGFSSSNAVLRDKIQNLLRLGYTFGGNLSEQESVSEKTVYNAYDLEEDSTNHVYHLCNVDKSWTLGDDNPDSDFEEITAESIMDKVESLQEKNIIIYNETLGILEGGTIEIDLSSLRNFLWIDVLFDGSKAYASYYRRGISFDTILEGTPLSGYITVSYDSDNEKLQITNLLTGTRYVTVYIK